MKLCRILCAALFCACVNLPGQIAGLPEHNCLCESFISHKDIDRLKNDSECMGYFGDVGAPGTPSYVAVCTRGSKNYFIKFIDFDYAAKKLRTSSEAPVPKNWGKERVRRSLLRVRSKGRGFLFVRGRVESSARLRC